MKISVPKILISRCLGFSWCRYDGEIIQDDFVQRLGNYVEFITVCPEVGIGLGIPRDPILLVQNAGPIEVHQPATGLVVTRELEIFSEKFISCLPLLAGALLKSRSPSCGVGDTKLFAAPTEAADRGLTSGLFAAAVRRLRPELPLETEAGLWDPVRRKTWLEAVFDESPPAELTG